MKLIPVTYKFDPDAISGTVEPVRQDIVPIRSDILTITDVVEANVPFVGDLDTTLSNLVQGTPRIKEGSNVVVQGKPSIKEGSNVVVVDASPPTFLSYFRGGLLAVAGLIIGALATTAPAADTSIDSTIDNLDDGEIGVLVGNVAFHSAAAFSGALRYDTGQLKTTSVGVLGGIVGYLGKTISSNMDLPYAPMLGRIIHSAGTSLTENALMGIDPLSRYNVHLGPISYTYHKGHNVGVDILTLLPTIITTFFDDLDLSTSLKTGSVAFHSPNFPFKSDDGLGGLASANMMVVSNPSSKKLVSHENIHTLQYSDFKMFNYLVAPNYPTIPGVGDGIRTLSDLVPLFSSINIPEMEARILQY